MSTVTLYRGDCLKMLDRFAGAEAVVTDPPYGINLRTNNTRFSGGMKVISRGSDFRRIAGDMLPFDPSPWLVYPKAVLWGANFYANRLPGGGWLVWNKKGIAAAGTFCGDAEVAWFKPGKAVYLFHHVWNGFCRATEAGKTIHPTQKPVALMRWCIERLKLKPGATIVDPYMGSGPVGVAAVELGFNYIGCEIDPPYFAIAKARIKAAQASAKLLEAV